jgi:hypothetical protein
MMTSAPSIADLRSLVRARPQRTHHSRLRRRSHARGTGDTDLGSWPYRLRRFLSRAGRALRRAACHPRRHVGAGSAARKHLPYRPGDLSALKAYWRCRWLHRSRCRALRRQPHPRDRRLQRLSHPRPPSQRPRRIPGFHSPVTAPVRMPSFHAPKTAPDGRRGYNTCSPLHSGTSPLPDLTRPPPGRPR